MRFRPDSPQGDLNGFVDQGSEVQGELRFATDFRVEGKVVGRVTSEGSLVVGEEGEVDGEVKVGELFISGTVKGTIQALRRVQIAPGGRVYADLSSPTLIIEDGAVFEGRCTMPRRGQPAEEAVPGPKRLAKLPGSKE
jgi:cytoskeletal protein CcmA (bactofilin family)